MRLGAVLVSFAVVVTVFGGTGVSAPSSPVEEIVVDVGIEPRLYPSGAPEVIYKKATCYGQLVTWYKDLETKYPGYMHTYYANQQYGTGTIPGRGSAACAPQNGNPYDTLYIRTTNESRGLLKPEVFFMGPLHGDEKTGAQANFWMLDWMFRTAFDPLFADPIWTPMVKWYLDNREIYMEASHNPYGYDATVRTDVDGDDLNREGDMDCCGATGKGLWGSVNGKTSREFANKHQVRTGTDWHGGAHALLTAWKSTHGTVTATSPISGRSQTFAPPDFYYFNVGMHRAAEWIGDYGGRVTASQIGPTPEVLQYQSPGALSGWFYGGDITNNPVEDPFVDLGPYPGAGVLWPTFELSSVKDAPESSLGGDLTIGYGATGRLFMLLLTDLAQPHLKWWTGSVVNNSQVQAGTEISLRWIVAGGLTADHAQLQYGTNPDPINNPQSYGPARLDFDHKYQGGTIWDNARTAGNTITFNPHVWEEKITLNTPGDYYFVAKSKLDQVYDTVAGESTYGQNHTYLRMIKERTKPGWTETIQGEDGAETMTGRLWWYSPVTKVTVTSSTTPPVVVQTSPADGAQAVATNSPIVVTFSKQMDPTSAQGATSFVPAFSGSYTWDATGTIMTLRSPTPLTASTTYAATVSTAAKDSSGLAMLAPKNWGFTTAATADTDRPYVVTTGPVNGATNVPIGTKIVVTFNESMDNPSAQAAFSMVPGPAGAFAWSTPQAMEFTPGQVLVNQTDYTVTIAKSASDLAGNQMAADHVLKFKTGGTAADIDPPTVISVFPADGSTAVNRAESIKVKFSESMNILTAQDAFAVYPGRGMAFTWNGNELTAVPDLKYDPGSLVQVTVGTGAGDIAGNKLAAEYEFSFRTEGEGVTEIPPGVYYTIPGDGDKDVPLDSKIEIAFTHDMVGTSLEFVFRVNPTLTFTVESAGTLATLKYTGKLAPATKYTIIVSKEATSTEGLTMTGPFEFSFTTTDGKAPPPPPPPTGTQGTFFDAFGPMLIVLLIMASAIVAVIALFASKRKREKRAQQAQQAYQQQQQQMWNQGGGGGWQ